MRRLIPDIRSLLALGLPLVGSQMAQMAIATTDTLMLGLYDARVLAGQVLGSSLFVVLFLFGAGFSFAVMPLVAAAEDETRVRRVTRMGLWLSMGFALVALVPMMLAGPLLRLAGQEPELAAIAQTYLRIFGLGIVPAMGVMVLKSYLSALERARVQLLVTLAAAVLNVGLNWVLIFGHFGAPELGVRGAAISSLVVNTVSFLALVAYARHSFPTHALFTRIWRPDREAMREVFAMGWQIGLTTLAEVGLFAATSLIMGMISTVALAAHGIAIQLASLSFMVPLGLSQAATVRAGRAFGRHDIAGLRRGALAALVVGLGWAALAVVVFLAVPDLLTGAFISADDPLRPEILATGRSLLAMAALFQLFDATQVVMMALLRGVHDTRAPMWIAASSYWLVGAPLAYGLGVTLGVGPVGVWLGLTLGLVVAAGLLSLRFWRHPAVQLPADI